MLSLLAKYARDHHLVAEPGFAPKSVKWALCFDPDGRFLDVLELGDTSEKRNLGMEFPVCPDLQQSELVGGAETRSHFLIDTAQVVALVFRDEDDAELNGSKVGAKHSSFVGLLKQASSVIPQLDSVSVALNDTPTLARMQASLSAKGAKPGDKVTIAVGSTYPVESDAWHDWWRQYRSGLRSQPSGAGQLMRCFVTGEMREPLKTHPKIKGLTSVGGLAMGDALVCFDKDAFTSFGFEQSANCAVCEDAASAYRAALNRLIAESGKPIAGSIVAHWYNKPIPPEFDLLPWIKEPPGQEEAVAAESATKLLASIREGQQPALANGLYYAVTVSGGGGRVMVRDWMDGRFESLVESIGRWFGDLQIINLNGSRLARDPGIERLATSMLMPKTDKQKYLDWTRPIQPQTRELWRAAMRRDSPIPHSALAKIVVLNTRFVQTSKLDEALSPNSISLIHARMALMKAYHIRKNGGECELTAYLNEEHSSPAYQCGRLMAMLRRIQWCALGNVGANVIQRFYGAASATPAIVFPRLVTLSNHHIAKISSKYGPNLANWYTNRVAEIVSRLRDSMPKTLTLEQQSLFALGYYQQIAFDSSKKPEKEAGLTDQQIETIENMEADTNE